MRKAAGDYVRKESRGAIVIFIIALLIGFAPMLLD